VTREKPVLQHDLQQRFSIVSRMIKVTILPYKAYCQIATC